MRTAPLAPFGVEITAIDLRQLGDDDAAQLDALYREHSLLVVRGQELTGAEQLAFMGRFGTPVDEGTGSAISELAHRPDPHGPRPGPSIASGELSFHSDQTYTPAALEAQSLFAVTLPSSGGETLFVHAGRAIASLPRDVVERIATLDAVHVNDPRQPLNGGTFRGATLGDGSFVATHPVVHRHPFRDEPVLGVTFQHTDHIVGLPRAESDHLLEELFAVLYASDQIYAHHWRAGDLLVWDNRVVQHARGTFDPYETRVLRRCVTGDQDNLTQMIATRRAMKAAEK